MACTAHYKSAFMGQGMTRINKALKISGFTWFFIVMRAVMHVQIP